MFVTYQYQVRTRYLVRGRIYQVQTFQIYHVVDALTTVQQQYRTPNKKQKYDPGWVSYLGKGAFYDTNNMFAPDLPPLCESQSGFLVTHFVLFGVLNKVQCRTPTVIRRRNDGSGCFLFRERARPALEHHQYKAPRLPTCALPVQCKFQPVVLLPCFSLGVLCKLSQQTILVLNGLVVTGQNGTVSWKETSTIRMV